MNIIEYKNQGNDERAGLTRKGPSITELTSVSETWSTNYGNFHKSLWKKK